MTIINWPAATGGGGGFTIKQDRYFATLGDRDIYPSASLEDGDICAVGFDPVTREFYQWNVDAWTNITLALQGRRGLQGVQGLAGINGSHGNDGAKIIAAAFEGDNIRFMLDDSSTFDLVNARIELKGEKGDTGTQQDIEAQLANKVDKVLGKELSTNDFTNVIKQFVDELQTGVIQNTNDFTFSQAGDALEISKNGVLLGKITPDGSWFAEAVGTGVGSFHLGNAHTMTSAGNNVGFVNEYAAPSAAERSFYVPVWQSLRMDGQSVKAPSFLHFTPLVPAIETNGAVGAAVVDYNYAIVGASNSVTYAVTVKAAETYSGVIVSSILSTNSGVEIYRSKQDFDCANGSNATVQARTPFFIRTGDALQMRFIKEDGTFLKVFCGADVTRPWTINRMRGFEERNVQWFENDVVLANTTASFTTSKDEKLANLDNRFRGIFADVAAAIAATPSPENGFYFQNLETNTIWQYDGSTWVNTNVTSNGDMVASTYDPNNVSANAFNRANHIGDVPFANVAGLVDALAEKQEVITGAASSILTNNLTSARVLISDGNGKVGASSVTANDLAGYNAAIAGKVDKATGKALSTNDFTDTLKDKLDDIAANATANSADATLLARANHTGVQAISTIDGLGTALSSKVNVVAGKALSANDFTNTLKDKLDGVADGATANSADATLLARANHTGTQPLNTISNAGNDIDVLLFQQFSNL